MARNKTLVICIDRDDDLGRKTHIDGPVFGKKKCLEAAVALATADPADTDANTMFAAVKVADEAKAEVAVLTGDIRVGVYSDKMITEQFDKLMKKGYKSVVFVSDGSDDEQLLPIIQSRTKILSVERVVVKQAERLESAYYTAIDFFKRVTKDKELARLFLGVPGMAIIIIALFGTKGWQFTLGFIGLYLLIKGLQLESYIEGFYNDFRRSFKLMKFSFFTYLISIILLGLGTLEGVNSVPGSPNVGLAIATFLYYSAFFYLGSVISVVVGRAVDAFPDFHIMLTHISSGVLFGVLVWVLRSVAAYVLEPVVGLANVITSVMVGFILVIIVNLLNRTARKV